KGRGVSGGCQLVRLGGRGMEEWQEIHATLTRLARTRAEQDYEIGCWLLAAQRARVAERLVYASVFEYGERLFGFSRRMVGERLRVARALEELPVMAAALRESEVCWSAAREMTRVATPATERAWIAAAAGRTVREIEAMVAERARGDGPDDPPCPDPEAWHVLRYEVRGATKALLRDAQAAIVREA